MGNFRGGQTKNPHPGDTPGIIFNANLKLKAGGLAALDKLKEIEVDGKATNAMVELDLTEHAVPPGTHNFHLQTQATGKYRQNPEAAKAAEAAAQLAEKSVADLTLALKTMVAARLAAVRATEEADTKAQAQAAALLAADRAPPSRPPQLQGRRRKS